METNNPFGNYFDSFSSGSSSNIESKNSIINPLKRKREESPKLEKRSNTLNEFTNSTDSDTIPSNDSLNSKISMNTEENNNIIEIGSNIITTTSTSKSLDSGKTTIKIHSMKLDSNLVEVIEDVRTIDINSINTLSEQELLHGNKNFVIDEKIKCIFGNHSVNRMISNLIFDATEGISFSLFKTKEEKMSIKITAAQLRENLMEILISMKPVVLCLRLNRFSSIHGIVSFSNKDRLFIRLPENLQDSQLEKIVSILKTIMLGPRDGSQYSTSIDIRCIHNRDLILMAKGEAKDLKESSSIIQSKIPYHLRTAFKIDSLTITLADVNRLDPQQFLNDNIIDYYLKEIYDKLSSDLQSRCYFFNSQFYPLISRHTERAAQRIPSPQLKIFDMDYIFIPICDHVHWTLCIICFPRNIGKTGMGDESARLEYCDSLGSTNSEALSLIRKYLRFRWKVENPDAPVKIFSPKTIPEHLAILPHQENNSDCGVYMLHYVEKFLELLPELPLVIPDWFTADEITMKRYMIKKLAMDRHKKYLEEI